MHFSWAMKLESRANKREHWGKRHRRDKEQKAIIRDLMLAKQLQLPGAPWRILLTRVKPHDRRIRFLDGDNLQASFKAIRDQIAASLGFDDGDEQVATWSYAQAVGPDYGIEVEISEVKP